MERSGRIRIVAVACVVLAGLSAAAPAKVIYVDDSAPGANDGSSWASAFVRLQSAIYTARSGDEIRVAQGLYKPDSYLPSTGTPTRPARREGGTVVDPRTVTASSFRLVVDVAIRGGFAGSAAEDPNARDWERYQTILSGDLNGDDPIASGPGSLVQRSLLDDNSAYVVQTSGYNVGSKTVLDGFILQGATRSGIYSFGGNPHIINCTFRRNVSIGAGGSAVSWVDGQPRFWNCVFRDNAGVTSGGAISLSGSTVTFTDCHFIHNWAMSLGGVIYSTRSVLTLTGCTFTENAGQQGGAVYDQHGSLSLTDCRFEGNMAGEQGGAVNLTQESAASMTRCVFRKNWTRLFGGALTHEGASLLLNACTFSENDAWCGAAIYTHGLNPLGPDSLAPAMVVTHCLFANNQARSTGGALWAYRAELTVDNSTFAQNGAPRGGTLGWPAVQGGEIVCRAAMENCITWDGKGSFSVAQVTATRGGGYELATAEVVIRYSDVQGGWPGDGNIDADPLFAGPGYWADASNPDVVVPPTQLNATWVEGDYHLKSQAGRWDPASESWVMDEVTSPCLDAGDPDAPVNGEPEPNGGRVNMGAYGGTAEASKSP